MNCPVCGERLREVQKYNVAMDICPGCKGTWLDRGVLERILETAGSGAPGPDRPVNQDAQYWDDRGRHDRRSGHDDDDDDDRGYGSDRGKRQRKGGFLGDILGGFGGGDD